MRGARGLIAAYHLPMSSSNDDKKAEIPAEDLSTVTGGVDYAYWHPNGFRVALGRDPAAAMAYSAANPGGQLMQRGADGAISPVPIKPGGE
jgi:hypothetical protein